MKPKEVEKILLKNGYKLIRSSGSHKTYKKDGVQNLVTIPFHNKDLKMGTLKSILKQAGLE